VVSFIFAMQQGLCMERHSALRRGGKGRRRAALLAGLLALLPLRAGAEDFAAYRARFSPAALGMPVSPGLATAFGLHYRGAMPHAAFAFATDGNAFLWRFIGGQPGAERAAEVALGLCTRDAAARSPAPACRLAAQDAGPPGAPRLPEVGTAPAPFRPAPLMFRHGPQAAAGVVVWAHGYGGPGQDYRTVPLPGLLAVLNDAGWDVLRHDRDPAADELHLALPALLRGLPALREAGYRRVMLGGQSRGGWQAMLAAAQRPELVDAVLATAPAAHGEASRPHPDALPDFSRAIAALPPDRVRLLVALFEEDPFDPSPTAREAAVQAAAAARMAPTLAIRPRAEVARGHNGAQDWRFTRLFAGCLLTWLDAPPAGTPRGVRREACGGG
jgi:pimeloyl-ACP methyl ester carboxylesterase